MAEEAGVTLAAHSDDPSLPFVRAQPRLVWQPQFSQKLIELKPSPRNALEFCVGTIAEMKDGNVHDAVETYSRQQKLGCVPLRNVRDKAPQMSCAAPWHAGMAYALGFLRAGLKTLEG